MQNLFPTQRGIPLLEEGQGKSFQKIEFSEQPEQAEPVNRTEELRKKFFTGDDAILKDNPFLVHERLDIGSHSRNSCAVIVRKGEIIAYL
jgi:hypothetical protein